ncbi:elongator complex protein 3 [Paucidesulfovibrio longus]|uniref:elongator complex protein 3 n=1 Tax=Paucidesulfovibrio longus TaxID=889 RepID=UPI0003B70401|nr:radical SAM protein [Paucidesulfovibrio longus]
MRVLDFAHPDPQTKTNGPRLRPVFLPFAGCPHRCAFCGQHLQTGQRARPLAEMHRALRNDLESARAAMAAGQTRPLELAFYGGTFTALPDSDSGPWPERFLNLAAEYRALGVVGRVRCSTRPDRTDPEMLARLKSLGLDMVELGVQSFDDAALAASGRGYDGETARKGCENVRAAGLRLGVQLMPGLPGDRPGEPDGTFRRDIEMTAALRPDAARLYPCLVIEGTPLAQTWRAGGYRPWSLERARAELAHGLERLWSAGVPVIRIGLHPEADLLPGILAGPWHPALGQMVRSLALCAHVLARARELGSGPKSLQTPRRFSGEIMGHKRELWERWKRARIRIEFHEGETFRLALATP